MATVHRPDVIELLNRLGDENDDIVRDAARALHRMVSDAGLTWAELLRFESDAAFGRDDGEPADAAPDDQPAAGRQPAPPDLAETQRLIVRLLASKAISQALRGDLTELQGNAAKGEFDPMDARYVVALAKRLGV